MSTIRKAARADLDAVCRIYDQIHTAEERGEAAIGWQRGVLSYQAWNILCYCCC